MAKLEWLVTQAKNYHYSTFLLYDEREFEEALKKFSKNIAREYKDPDKIIWNDENIMLVIRKMFYDKIILIERTGIQAKQSRKAEEMVLIIA
ncbi:MAG: hypothetical protein GQ476_06540 [Candidatus Aminicenantes bacterium]|nr:hypothetical protein [Candidatus Aminicenantes bacterium]